MCLNNNQKPKSGKAAAGFCCSRSRFLLRRRENKPPCQHLSLASIICFPMIKSKVFCFFLSLLCAPVRNAGRIKAEQQIGLSIRKELVAFDSRLVQLQLQEQMHGGGAASASSGRDRQNHHVWRSGGRMATKRREKRGNTKAVRIPAFVSPLLVTLVRDLPSGFSRESCFPH